ncbi:MAG TPA: hypothetical protein VFB84_02865 [Micromonosporaceae bacterium]|nr:hypothetical protein [Micromonosporaceae bacterium]
MSSTSRQVPVPASPGRSIAAAGTTVSAVGLAGGPAAPDGLTVPAAVVAGGAGIVGDGLGMRGAAVGRPVQATATMTNRPIITKAARARARR